MMMLQLIFSVAGVLTVRAAADAAVDITQMKALGGDKCTAIAVGRKATADDSTMTTHTADCAECDWRISKVPARDWPEGTLRPIYLLTAVFPRAVRSDRGATWTKENLKLEDREVDWAGIAADPSKETEAQKMQREQRERAIAQRGLWEEKTGTILGYIPQVPHTYALIEGMYGIMNEHGVSIGESTCASKLFAAPIGYSTRATGTDADIGKALLEITELSQIALERGATARQAIAIMGSLAEQYGFYSAEWDVEKFGSAWAMGEGGEALTVTDKTEAWMFHITPDDTGASAVWVAQRIPDDHISAVANSFVIKEVIPDSPDFMYSSNLWSVAEKLGWWKPGPNGPKAKPYLNFVTTYAPQRYHPNYSNRRVWRIFSLAAPDMKLNPNPDPYALEYPFSVKVTRSLLTVEDLMFFQRDHFEGTEFSLTEGLAAGPWGDPNRYGVPAVKNVTKQESLDGEFGRAISLFRTSYSFVTHSRASVPNVLSMLWIAENAPDTSVYIPLYVAADALPTSWIRGNMQRYDPRSAWWNFCAVGNYAARFYSATIVPIRALQAEFQKEMNDAVSQLEASVLKMLAKKDSSKSVVESLTDFGIYYGEKVSDRWRMLLPEMMTTYRDGLVVKNLDGDRVQLSSIGYPKDWLTAVGYFSVTPNVDGILFAPSPIPTTSDHTILLVGIVILLVAASSFFLGHRSQKLIEAVAESRDAYEMIGNKTSATESCNGHKSKSNGGYQVINEMTSLKSSYNIEI